VSFLYIYSLVQEFLAGYNFYIITNKISLGCKFLVRVTISVGSVELSMDVKMATVQNHFNMANVYYVVLTIPNYFLVITIVDRASINYSYSFYFFIELPFLQ